MGVPVQAFVLRRFALTFAFPTFTMWCMARVVAFKAVRHQKAFRLVTVVPPELEHETFRAHPAEEFDRGAIAPRIFSSQN